MNNFTKNLVDSITKEAKVLAKSMFIGENTIKNFRKHSSTLLIKDTGKSISKKTIKLFDVIISPSRDFENSTHVFEIFVISIIFGFLIKLTLFLKLTAWTIDLMVWNTKDTFTSTQTVDLQFWHANCQKYMHHFKNPAKIWLKINESKSFKEKFWSFEVSVPENTSIIYGHNLNQFIKIHKIDVPKHTTVSINFLNVEPDKSLQVFEISSDKDNV